MTVLLACSWKSIQLATQNLVGIRVNSNAAKNFKQKISIKELNKQLKCIRHCLQISILAVNLKTILLKKRFSTDPP